MIYTGMDGQTYGSDSGLSAPFAPGPWPMARHRTRSKLKDKTPPDPRIFERPDGLYIKKPGQVERKLDIHYYRVQAAARYKMKGNHGWVFIDDIDVVPNFKNAKGSPEHFKAVDSVLYSFGALPEIKEYIKPAPPPLKSFVKEEQASKRQTWALYRFLKMDLRDRELNRDQASYLIRGCIKAVA